MEAGATQEVPAAWGRGQQETWQKSGELWRCGWWRVHWESAPCILQTVPCAHEARVPVLGKWPMAAQFTELLPVGPHPWDSTGESGHGSRAPGTARGPSWGSTRAARARDTGAVIGHLRPTCLPLGSDHGLSRMARGSRVGCPNSLQTDTPSVAFVSILWGRNVCVTTSPPSCPNQGSGYDLCSLQLLKVGAPQHSWRRLLPLVPGHLAPWDTWRAYFYYFGIMANV